MRTIFKGSWELKRLIRRGFPDQVPAFPDRCFSASRILARPLLWMAGALALLTVGATAADIIERAPQKPGDCVYQLSGEIKPGDFAKVSRLDLSRARFDNGESTANLVICLDSPGGDFQEGMLIAEYFHLNGAGTLLEPRAECLSVCAIIFMMGVAEGAEVSFVNRSMHITSILGFHRPYLPLEQAARFTPEDAQTVFGHAMRYIAMLTFLANKKEPWSSQTFIRSDLVEIILRTPREQMFFVKSVDDAGRWNIKVNGIGDFIKPGPASAYFACENALRWNTGRHPNSALLNLNNRAMHAIPETLDPVILGNDKFNSTGFYFKSLPVREPDGSYRVASSKAGYAAAGCHLKFEAKGIRICGVDEVSDTRIGDGVCASDDLARTGEWMESPLLAYPPDMFLPFFGLDGFDEGYDSAVRRQCTIVTATGERLVRDSCVSRVKMHWSPQGHLVSREFSYLWADGSDTHLEINYDRSGSIDGLPRRTLDIHGVPVRHRREFITDCLEHSVSGKSFCVGLPMSGSK